MVSSTVKTFLCNSATVRSSHLKVTWESCLRVTRLKKKIGRMGSMILVPWELVLF